MAEIKTGNKITATDLTTLKTAIKTMYDNRSLTSAQIGYAGDALDTSKTFSQYSSENLEQIQDLINACLVINDIPNLLFRNSSERSEQKIFEAGTATDLLAWVNNRKTAVNNTGTHGCRAACLGTCSGGCSKQSTGGTPGGDGSGSVSPGSSSKCSTCSGTCYGCSTTCHGCSGECGGACTSYCEVNCYSTCGFQCTTSCSNKCINECTGVCVGCSSYCTGKSINTPT